MNLFKALLKKDKLIKDIEIRIETVTGADTDEDNIYEDIIENYRSLIKLLKINNFTSFEFESYDDPRVVIIDGKEYDFDCLFSRKNAKAYEHLCAIDSLIADINCDEATVLAEIEERILL